MKVRHTVLAIALFACGALSTPLDAQSAARGTAAAGVVERGAINGAAFRIEIPANWNKGLVMYAHGYREAGDKADPEGPGSAAQRAVFLSRGFAFAESAYSAGGWAVKEGVEDTEALRRYFVAKFGKPNESYITGHSMGGHITIATIERYPEEYQGAMPMCGPLGPAVDFLNTGPFDMLVTFEALFPDTVGSPYEPAAAKVPKVKAAIAAHPELAAKYAQRFARPVSELTGVLALFRMIAGELKQRAGGEPFDNTNRIYSGFGDDASLNRAVKRYAADPAAREYLRQYATPTGRIADPVLTLQTTSDPLVLGTDVTVYDTLAAVAGTSDRFVARFVDAKGHCNFTPAQTASAFDALRAWARDGRRPTAGEQK
jgi:alpha-beta hydrolase superfamily lysophospholipase